MFNQLDQVKLIGINCTNVIRIKLCNNPFKFADKMTNWTRSATLVGVQQFICSKYPRPRPPLPQPLLSFPPSPTQFVNRIEMITKFQDAGSFLSSFQGVLVAVILFLVYIDRDRIFSRYARRKSPTSAVSSASLSSSSAVASSEDSNFKSFKRRRSSSSNIIPINDNNNNNNHHNYSKTLSSDLVIYQSGEEDQKDAKEEQQSWRSTINDTNETVVLRDTDSVLLEKLSDEFLQQLVSSWNETDLNLQHPLVGNETITDIPIEQIMLLNGTIVAKAAAAGGERKPIASTNTERPVASTSLKPPPTTRDNETVTSPVCDVEVLLVEEKSATETITLPQTSTTTRTATTTVRGTFNDETTWITADTATEDKVEEVEEEKSEPDEEATTTTKQSAVKITPISNHLPPDDKIIANSLSDTEWQRILRRKRPPKIVAVTRKDRSPQHQQQENNSGEPGGGGGGISDLMKLPGRRKNLQLPPPSAPLLNLAPSAADKNLVEQMNKDLMKRWTRFFAANTPMFLDMWQQIQEDFIDSR